MINRRKRILVIIGAIAAVGVVIAAVLYVVYPVQMTTVGGLARNYLLTLSTTPGTVNTEVNPAYKADGAVAPSLPAETSSPNAAAADWPSYNRTLNSQRYSPLSQINAKNVGKLKVLCTYDTNQFASFESGLIMVGDALIGTTEFDTFSLNPASCAENWRTHEDYQPNLLPSNRGPAYWDGMLFRGTQDGRVLAYDFKTGKRLWATRIADAKIGESVPSAPIASDGLVFIGNAGGDFKGGKGHVFALEAKTGKIVWEFFLAPKVDGDVALGPLGVTPLDASTWKTLPGIGIDGAGTWTSYTLDTKTGLLYVPVGDPAPAFSLSVRKGENLYSDSVVVLDAKTGDYKSHVQIVSPDWHDWDVSSPPILIQTKGGKQLMALAPKDGHLYGFDLATNTRLYRVPVTRVENAEEPFSQDKAVHFCPGSVGGTEWNSPGYDPSTNLIFSGTVEWCTTVTVQSNKKLEAAPVGQPWSGMSTLNPINMFGKNTKTDGTWAGWVYATDADTGVWKWRVKSNFPIVAAITPTAGGVVFFADVGGNFYALDSSNGEKLFGQVLGGGGGIGGGIITYTANGTQKIAVAAGFSMVAWPTKPVTAKVIVLGLDSGSADQ